MVLVDRLIITLEPMAVVVMVEISIVEISRGIVAAIIDHRGQNNGNFGGN